MEVFENISDITDNAKRCVIAIGNFDGVHLGHQALIRKAKLIAQEQNKPLAVLTFEPHPRRLFQPDRAPERITPKTQKIQQLEKVGVDFLFSLPFDWAFASQTAEEFIQNILISGLEATYIVVGFNFCFGQLRKGSADTIKEAGIPVETIAPIKDLSDKAISSSRVRQYLRAGQIDEANKILGWDWEIQGKIFRGDRRGHELGYPTANILLNDTVHPAYGVYACLVQIEGENIWRPAATNIGIRPMFEVAEGQVEAYILDFPDRDIYDQKLRVKPVKRLRSEAKFNSLDDLTAQMDKDCQKTREILE